ncbi:uncharacterized protein BDR25DRAFT_369101 [Lindgomyces ingoldianus]|uniref:Uncharacterized protein n=1 Tax=Lindgomyces ingoldianus TaxID=673940 RepID=A0ACB6QX56_9PLEO|nr:uncharacterized protein BDR25DRAFT_369101 [Lindgomyces ingoldianus]KAF2470660.1 hypothetical protein BDR25DRAFT_369101 [Lindgomyces ingoldianus]
MKYHLPPGVPLSLAHSPTSHPYFRMGSHSLGPSSAVFSTGPSAPEALDLNLDFHGTPILDLQQGMRLSDYRPSLPSPPLSAECKTFKIKTIVSYLGAIRRGNAFLYLHRHIRDRIYAFVLSDPEFQITEVPDVRDIRNPEVCEVNNRFYSEATQVLIQNTTFAIPSHCAIYNLMVFLNEFPENQGYERVTSLEFTGLGLFETSAFSSDAAALVRRCPNVKGISLIIHLEDLTFTYTRGCREVDMQDMAEKYDLKEITALDQLEVLTLYLEPFMALQKRVASMERDRVHDEQMAGSSFGVESFWGLKEWFEMEFLDRMRLVEVRCPKLEEIFPYGLPLENVGNEDEPVADARNED